MIVYPDGSVTGSVNVEELEEIQKVQKGLSAEQLEAIGPVESLAQLMAALEPEPEPEQEAAPAKATRAKKEA